MKKERPIIRGQRVIISRLRPMKLACDFRRCPAINPTTRLRRRLANPVSLTALKMKRLIQAKR